MIEINGKIYRNLQEQVAKNKLDIEELNFKGIDEIKNDVEELKTEIESLKLQEIPQIKNDVEELKTKTNNLENTVNQLSNEFNTSYHITENFKIAFAPNSFETPTRTATLRNENFSLYKSIISWSPLGERNNINTIAECGLMLLEQTEEGEITFSVTSIPTNSITVVITVYTKKL